MMSDLPFFQGVVDRCGQGYKTALVGYATPEQQEKAAALIAATVLLRKLDLPKADDDQMEKAVGMIVRTLLDLQEECFRVVMHEVLSDLSEQQQIVFIQQFMSAIKQHNQALFSVLDMFQTKPTILQ